MKLFTFPVLYRQFYRLIWVVVLLAAVLVMWDAFVRLAADGVSCYDWPICEGRIAWSKYSAPFPVDTAVRHIFGYEQVQYAFASSLTLLALILAALALRRWRLGVVQVLVAAALAVAALVAHFTGLSMLALILGVVAECLLLWLFVGGVRRKVVSSLVGVLAVIVLQLLWGVWTSTWLQKQVVMVGYMLGDMVIFVLLVWAACRVMRMPIHLVEYKSLRYWAIFTALLLGVVISLGAWVSVSEVGWACGVDALRCQGQWWPAAGDTSVTGQAIAAHMGHRLGAVTVLIAMLWLFIRLLPKPGMRGWAVVLGVLPLVQIALGVASLKFGLPVYMVLLHDAWALLMLFVVVSLAARLKAPE